MPLLTSNLAGSQVRLKKPRKPELWEQVILGVVDGGGKITEELAGLASKYGPTKNNAEQILRDVKKTRQDLEPNLNNVGRAASVGSAAIPDLMLSGPGTAWKAANAAQSLGRAYGNDDLAGGLVGQMFRGNNLASNLNAQGAQELVNYIKSLFQ